MLIWLIIIVLILIVVAGSRESSASASEGFHALFGEDVGYPYRFAGASGSPLVGPLYNSVPATLHVHTNPPGDQNICQGFAERACAGTFGDDLYDNCFRSSYWKCIQGRRRPILWGTR
jgi:hypothetical protein